MSDGDQQPTPTNLLEGLSFAPDWAKGSSDSHYTHLNKYAARFDADAERRRADGRDRPFGKRPPRGDRPPRSDRPFGDRPPRGERRDADHFSGDFSGDRPPRRDEIGRAHV